MHSPDTPAPADADAAARKAAIRDRARRTRRALSSAERASLSRLACERLLSLPEAGAGVVILGYVASAEELDPGRALVELAARGSRVLLPRVSGPAALTLHELPRESAEWTAVIEPGTFGIGEPRADLPEVHPDEVGLAIVPGLAFDPQGGRIGYGGGFYDRILARMGAAPSVGTCFDEQLIDRVPVEKHDRRVGLVITPTRTLRIGS